MDVTKDNFVDMLPLIKDSIAQAEFIAFDTEFSGNSLLFLSYCVFRLKCGLR